MIKLLEKHIADKIAAGEVVDRPLSVVKELVENSIDAESSSITVEIKNGGKSYIRVSDDGCGIEPQDVELAFKRHATSKISTVEDLDSINTLGFRGEALASISAVSKTSLITKTNNSRMGTRVDIDGSQLAEIKAFGCDTGTSVIVNDLFYNTPARLKFMKSDSAEASLIIDFVSQIALCYPEIKIKMVNNGSILFSTPGKGDRLNTIATIYGRTVSNCLVEVDYSQDGLKVSGYVSNTGESRNSKKHQIFYVNGRLIYSKVLSNAVKDAYHERLFAGRYPIAILFLEIPAETLDVNIHPNKREIRFDNDRMIEEITSNAIKRALATKAGSPEITESKFKCINNNNSEYRRKSDVHSFVNADEKESINKLKISDTHEISKSFGNELKGEIVINDKADQSEEQVHINELLSSLRSQSKATEKTANYISEIDKRFEFGGLKYIGSVFGTYIVTYDETYMYLIDQHAAHERVFYEKLVEEFNSSDKNGQLIMKPVLFEIPAAVTDYSFINTLESVGYRIEEFGNRTFKADEIPSFMSIDEAETFLKDYIGQLDSETTITSDIIKDDIAKRACKAAVKGNHILTEKEIKALLDDLSLCRNPYSCPHGRPTYIRMSKSQLERMFKRA